MLKRAKIEDQGELQIFLDKFGSFFYEFSGKEISASSYYLLFVVKRYAIVSVILLCSELVSQLTISIVFTLAVSYI